MSACTRVHPDDNNFVPSALLKMHRHFAQLCFYELATAHELFFAADESLRCKSGRHVASCLSLWCDEFISGGIDVVYGLGHGKWCSAERYCFCELHCCMGMIKDGKRGIDNIERGKALDNCAIPPVLPPFARLSRVNVRN